ncbi:DNA-binding protein WhiA, partial [Staphylococcus epidermidis]|uniref:DNA-binding protein WhiA n=1 Tax=Staphylococcus epidermidis TaxID=1282 RepID=UPI00119D4E37
LNKTLTPPIKHLQTIQLIHQQIHLQNLPHPLTQLPNLTLQHQEISLKQFPHILSTPPISKSPINHPLTKFNQLPHKITNA